jgi:hypothetical protein
MRSAGRNPRHGVAPAACRLLEPERQDLVNIQAHVVRRTVAGEERAVVLPPRLRIGKDAIGFLDLLKVTGLPAAVRMVAQGKHAVSLDDDIAFGSGRQPEDLIVVIGHAAGSSAQGRTTVAGYQNLMIVPFGGLRSGPWGIL